MKLGTIILVAVFATSAFAERPIVTATRVMDERAIDSIARVRPTVRRLNVRGVPIDPDQLPSIPGATIQVVAPPNGDGGRKVMFFTTDLSGTFVVRGVDDSGNAWSFGSFSFSSNFPAGAIGAIWLQNGNIGTVLPAFFGFHEYEVFRQDGGILQRLSATVATWSDPAQAGPSFQIVDANVIGGQLSVKLVGALSAEAVVQIGGGGAFSVFTSDSSGGGTAVLAAAETNGLWVGPTTITVCDKGACGTSTFKWTSATITTGGGGSGKG